MLSIPDSDRLRTQASLTSPWHDRSKMKSGTQIQNANMLSSAPPNAHHKSPKPPSVVNTEVALQLAKTRVGRGDEWHLDMTQVTSAK